MDSQHELDGELKLGYVGIGWQLNNIPSHYELVLASRNLRGRGGADLEEAPLNDQGFGSPQHGSGHRILGHRERKDV